MSHDESDAHISDVFMHVFDTLLAIQFFSLGLLCMHTEINLKNGLNWSFLYRDDWNHLMGRSYPNISVFSEEERDMVNRSCIIGSGIRIYSEIERSTCLWVLEDFKTVFKGGETSKDEGKKKINTLEGATDTGFDEFTC